jgi:hypothetical protein
MELNSMNTQHKNIRCLGNLRHKQASESEASLNIGSIIISVSVILVVTVLLGYAYLAYLNNFLLNLPSVIGTCALVVSAVCALGWTAELHKNRGKLKPESKTYVRCGALILLVALAVRLLFIARMPELSDDIYRYIWDGLQVRLGKNPYTLPPAAIQTPQGHMACIHERINHPELVTIYPPVAQFIFALGSGSLLWMKGVFILFDLGSCALILRLLRLLQRHPAWLCLYAWHPLAVLESSASGHVDVAAVFFILAAVYFTLRPDSNISGLGAGTALGLAVMTKIFPLIFAPLMFAYLPAIRRNAFILGLTLVCTCACIPFWPELQNGLETLKLYASNWEFSGFTFRILRTWMDSGSDARMLLMLSFCLIFAWQWLKLYRSKWSTFMAQEHVQDANTFVYISANIMLTFLLLTPTLHPWYAIYLLALLPLTPGMAGVALSWSVLLSYQVAAIRALSGIWQESNLLSFYVFAAPVSALCITLLLARRRTRR